MRNLKFKFIDIVQVFIITSLIITRLFRLDWGFPYLFHPDENNINRSVIQLTCSKTQFLDCLNPNFFAYGQLTIYLSAVLNLLTFNLLHIFPLKILSVAYCLRLISAISSIISGILLFKVIKKETGRPILALFGLWLFTFSPGLIQQAHFGTTESIILLSVCALLYFRSNYYLQALFIGLAISAKPSGLTLFSFLFLTLFFNKSLNIKNKITIFAKSFFITLFTVLITSPHYVLHLVDFIKTFIYEVGVANGKIRVFYTTQFWKSTPIVFQYQKILVFALGLPLTFFGTLSLPFLFKKHKPELIFFIFSFLYYSFLYAKWTRFMAPYFPLFIFALVVALNKFTKHGTLLKKFILGFSLIQFYLGISFFTIYLFPDTRVQANYWFNKNVAKNSMIISESANVVDTPFNYYLFSNYQSFFLYDLDTNKDLQNKVFTTLEKADYVIVPSRRIFANYFMKNQYPYIDKYYQTVFNSSKYTLVKTFSSGLNDEQEEETLSVFDHPVIRIYKRTLKKTEF